MQMPIPAKPERRLMPTGRVRLKERKMDRRTIFDAWTGACSSGALGNINELSPAEAQGIARMTVKEFDTIDPGSQKIWVEEIIYQSGADTPVREMAQFEDLLMYSRCLGDNERRPKVYCGQR